MKTKNLLILFMFILIAIIMIPNVVNAADGNNFTIDGITYTVLNENNKTVEVSGYEQGLTNAIISETVKNGETTYTVTSIGDKAFYECNTLTSIEIADSVTSIGNQAFWECRALTSIEMPKSVTSIGSNAFTFCTSLESVEIPESVTTIGDWAFRYCESLTNITIPDSVTYIGKGAFEECDAITSIVIPDSITSISDRMLYGCESLESVTIPNSITSIGDTAFKSCKSLKNITIPDTVKSIGKGAFAICKLLTNIIIPEGVTSIEAGTFLECTSLKGIIIPNSVKTIGTDVFWSCSSLTDILIPDSVTSIGENAFKGCDSLKIYAHTNSIAKEYAKQNNIEFEDFYKVIINIAEGADIFIKEKLITSTLVEEMTSGEGIGIEMKIIAKKGYKINAIKVNGVEQTLSGNLLTIENITEDKNVVIETEPEKYTLTFNSNGGTGNMNAQIFTYGVEQAISLNKFTKEGYEFKEWNTKADGTGNSYSNNQKVKINEDLTLYAMWKEKEYTYKFIEGNNQTFILNKIDRYSFKIDGNYSLFTKLTIGDLNLAKDVDFTVTNGSTIITFTKTGLIKLNTLAVGTYDVIVEYSNDKEVKGTLTIKADTPNSSGVPGIAEKDDGSNANDDDNNANIENTNTQNANTQNTNTQNTNKSNGNNLQTGDTIIMYVSTFIISLIVIIAIIFKKKSINTKK